MICKVYLNLFLLVNACVLVISFWGIPNCDVVQKKIVCKCIFSEKPLKPHEAFSFFATGTFEGIAQLEFRRMEIEAHGIFTDRPQPAQFFFFT